MAKIQVVGLQRRTINIMNDFFKDIDELNDKNLSNYQMNLSIRVKKFFEDMNQVGIEEFARLLEKHQFKNTDPAQQPKYKDAFKCLVAYIVAEYDKSDLLRYFIPRDYSDEDQPKKSESSSIIIYWAKFLTYWLGSKLFNRQKFKFKTDRSASELAIDEIKKDLSESNYFDLQQNDNFFKENLKTVVGKFIENRNIMNVEYADDTASNGDASPQRRNSVEVFNRFVFETSSSSAAAVPKTPAPSTSSIGDVIIPEQPIAHASEIPHLKKSLIQFEKIFSGLFSKKETDEQPVKMTFAP